MYDGEKIIFESVRQVEITKTTIDIWLQFGKMPRYDLSKVNKIDML